MSSFCYHTLDENDQCTMCGIYMEEKTIQYEDEDGPELFWGVG